MADIKEKTSRVNRWQPSDLIIAAGTEARPVGVTTARVAERVTATHLEPRAAQSGGPTAWESLNAGTCF